VNWKTTASWLLAKLTSRGITLTPPYESPEDLKEQAKNPRTIFLRIRILKNYIRIRSFFFGWRMKRRLLFTALV
jgi:hypothetical protein